MKRQRRPCEDRDRDRSDAAASQAMLRISSNYQKLGGSLGKILFHAFRESVALPIL